MEALPLTTMIDSRHSGQDLSVGRQKSQCHYRMIFPDGESGTPSRPRCVSAVGRNGDPTKGAVVREYTSLLGETTQFLPRSIDLPIKVRVVEDIERYRMRKATFLIW